MASGQKPASPAVVDLYRAAYNADHPLTFTELVEAMPSAYQNDANRAYAKFWDEMGNDPIPDPWSRRQLRTALEWWVGELVSEAVSKKRLFGRTTDGTRSWGKPRKLLVYTANRDNPPTVMEEVLVARPTKWTPEIGATGRRHVAGIKFRDEVTRLERLGTGAHGKATKADMWAALELAVEALSHGPSPK